MPTKRGQTLMNELCFCRGRSGDVPSGPRRSGHERGCARTVAGAFLLALLLASGTEVGAAMVGDNDFRGKTPTVSFGGGATNNLGSPTNLITPTVTNQPARPEFRPMEGWAPPTPSAVAPEDLEAPGDDAAASSGGLAVFERSGPLFVLIAALFVVGLIAIGLNAMARRR